MSVNVKKAHTSEINIWFYLCHQSSKILLKRLPEANGIFWLASKNRKFHVNAGVKSLEESIALINFSKGEKSNFLIFSNSNLM